MPQGGVAASTKGRKSKAKGGKKDATVAEGFE